MTELLLRICAIDRCSSFFFNDYHHSLKEAHNRALIARASAAAARLWRRRANRAHVTPLHKRRLVYGSHSLQRIVQRRLEMASQQEVRRRSSAADRTSAEPALTAAAEATATATTSPTLVSNTADLSHDHDHDQEPESVLPAESAASNPAPFTPRPSSASRDDDDATAGRSRATSLAARNANRLSLTLPIAPPSSCPSRPTPAAATSSMPPTPSENSVIASPTAGRVRAKSF
jgi:hypothetical protein